MRADVTLKMQKIFYYRVIAGIFRTCNYFSVAENLYEIWKNMLFEVRDFLFLEISIQISLDISEIPYKIFQNIMFSSVSNYFKTTLPVKQQMHKEL